MTDMQALDKQLILLLHLSLHNSFEQLSAQLQK